MDGGEDASCRGRGRRGFPERLRALVDNDTEPNFWWSPGGDGIIVEDPSGFTTPATFTRTMYDWGFRKTPYSGTAFLWIHKGGLFRKDDADNDFKLLRSMVSRRSRKTRESESKKIDSTQSIRDVSNDNEQDEELKPPAFGSFQNSNIEVEKCSLGVDDDVRIDISPSQGRGHEIIRHHGKARSDQEIDAKDVQDPKTCCADLTIDEHIDFNIGIFSSEDGFKIESMSELDFSDVVMNDIPPSEPRQEEIATLAVGNQMDGRVSHIAPHELRFWTIVNKFLFDHCLLVRTHYQQNCNNHMNVMGIANAVEDLEYLLGVMSRFKTSSIVAGAAAAGNLEGEIDIHEFIWIKFGQYVLLDTRNNDTLSDQVYWVKKKLQDLLSSHFAAERKVSSAIEALSDQLDRLHEISPGRQGPLQETNSSGGGDDDDNNNNNNNNNDDEDDGDDDEANEDADDELAHNGDGNNWNNNSGSASSRRGDFSFDGHFLDFKSDGNGNFCDEDDDDNFCSVSVDRHNINEIGKKEANPNSSNFLPNVCVFKDNSRKRDSSKDEGGGGDSNTGFDEHEKNNATEEDDAVHVALAKLTLQAQEKPKASLPRDPRYHNAHSDECPCDDDLSGVDDSVHITNIRRTTTDPETNQSSWLFGLRYVRDLVSRNKLEPPVDNGDASRRSNTSTATTITATATSAAVGSSVMAQDDHSEIDQADDESVLTHTTASKSIATATSSLLEAPVFVKGVPKEIVQTPQFSATWNTTSIPSMQIPREDFAAVMLHDERKVVVLGGQCPSGDRASLVESTFIQAVKEAEADTAQSSSQPQQWTNMCEMTRARSSFGAAIALTRSSTDTATPAAAAINTAGPPPDNQCHLVVAGGYLDTAKSMGGWFDGFCATDSAEIWNLSTNDWMELPHLQVKRRGCAMTSLYSSGVGMGHHVDYDGRVYVVGGVRGVYRDSVEWLDVSTVVQEGSSIEKVGWQFLPSRMKLGREFCAAVMLQYSDDTDVGVSKADAGDSSGGTPTGLKLVVLGGLTKDTEVTNAVECFDFGSAEWHDLPPMRTRRRQCAAVAIGCCIYVVGGCDERQKSLATVESFDFRTQSWTLLTAEMSVPRQGCGAVVMRGNPENKQDTDNDGEVCHRFVVLGGYDINNGTTHSSVETLEIREPRPILPVATLESTGVIE